MLDELDSTLQRLIVAKVAGLAENEVQFKAPDRDFAPSTPVINFFLYDVRENTELRAADWQVHERDGKTEKRRAPRRVDCSYLVSAWAGDVQSEHRLLGQVLRALLRNNPIAAEYLPEESTLGSEPLPISVLHPGNLQSIGEFWQAMGNKPRAAINLTVTIAVEIFDPVSVTPVQRRELRTHQAQVRAGDLRPLEQTRESVVREAPPRPTREAPAKPNKE